MLKVGLGSGLLMATGSHYFMGSHLEFVLWNTGNSPLYFLVIAEELDMKVGRVRAEEIR